MKRDTDLIVKILEDVERDGSPNSFFTGFEYEGHSQAEVEYHVALCKNEGYFDLNNSGLIKMLSMYGHDVLENMRGD